MNLERKYYSKMNSMNVTEEDEVGYCNKQYSKVSEMCLFLLKKTNRIIDKEKKRL